MIDVHFSVELYFCCSTIDCLLLNFIILLCVLGNGVGITLWESHENGNNT